MKKLFTTLLMMGVALCGWATITETSDGTTVTLDYVDDGNQNDQNFSLQNRTATTVVLTGDWANKDLGKLDKVLDQCQNNIYLDMSACEGFVSKIEYTGTKTSPDWTSDDFRYVYSNTQPVEQAVTKKTVYYFASDNSVLQQYQIDQITTDGNGDMWWSGWLNSAQSNGPHKVLTKEEWGYYSNYWGNDPDPNSWVSVDPSSVTDNGNGTGTALVTPAGDPFKFKDGNFNSASKLSGIAFPNSENFTAIPDDLLNEKTNLRTVVLGTSVVWIGNNAFRRTGLTSVNFHANLKVIGSESFDKSGLTEVDLSACTSLVAIKYEAFEGTSTITSVTFPPSSSFTFLGNDAFKELTSLTSVDMSMCTGIEEFQSKNNDGATFKTFYGCTSLKTVILPPYLTAVPDDYGMGVFNACGNIETLTFTGTPVYNDCELQNPCTIGDNAFAFNTKLSSITFSKNISYIGYQAFHSAAITEIHIPASVEELAKHSFYKCSNLKIVYFDEFDKTYGTCDGAATKIAGGYGSGGQGQAAFEECQSITDVYINTMADLQCGNNGFDQDITWGAGDAGADFAMLHYPKEKVEHYVNLHHYLTDEIVANAGLFHDWLEEHYYQAIVPHKNGWYEFINSGPTIPNEGPELQDIVLRTFSDWDYAYLVPNGIRAYVVNKIEKVGDNYEVSLQRLRVIPKRTGVILYGHPNAKSQDGKPALVFTPVKFKEHGDPIYEIQGEGPDAQEVQVGTYDGPDQGAPLCRANWNLLDEGHMKYKNYLEPIITADGSRVAIKPYETVKVNGKAKTKFRNFGLGRYTSTDYYKNDASTLNEEKNFVGFFRMKPQNYNSGYAYLRLRGEVDEEGHTLPYTNPETEEVYVNEYDTPDGGEILVKPDTPVFDKVKDILPYHYEYKMSNGEAYDAQAAVGDASLNPKGWWNKNATPNAFVWDEYQLSWGNRSEALKNQSALKYFGELEEDADGMAKIVIPADDVQDVYYTLQGVRVTNPTKGVYILNGKKVIVK